LQVANISIGYVRKERNWRVHPPCVWHMLIVRVRSRKGSSRSGRYRSWPVATSWQAQVSPVSARIGVFGYGWGWGRWLGGEVT